MTNASAASIVLGDCVSVMAGMAAGSVDAVVTDPPYGLEFMGKEWDRLRAVDVCRPDETSFHRSGATPFDRARVRHASAASSGGGAGREMQRWHERWAEESLRVLKPGAHLLAFGGTRTYHRLASALEDVGFEVRDCIAWLYGQGFPKSLDVSKAIDRSDVRQIRRQRDLRFTAWLRSSGLSAARLNELTGSFMGGHYLTQGAQPQVPTPEHWDRIRPHIRGHVPSWVDDLVYDRAVESRSWRARPVTGRYDRYGVQDWRARYDGRGQALEPRERRDLPASAAARRWHGWGTALKPAFEPVVVARKPLAGTVAANVLEHATGALNIDACRLSTSEAWAAAGGSDFAGDGGWENAPRQSHPGGRWPANVAVDEEAATLLDAQAGARGGGYATAGASNESHLFAFGNDRGAAARGYDDSGGASRFFYCAKAGRTEREAGLDELPARRFAQSGGGQTDAAGAGERYADSFGLNRVKRVRNTHPTVKPVALMRWLVRLVTPPGGLVLDPFAGSGTTGIACLLEGFRFFGIEREPAYVEIARARIAHWAEESELVEVAAA